MSEIPAADSASGADGKRKFAGNDSKIRVLHRMRQKGNQLLLDKLARYWPIFVGAFFVGFIGSLVLLLILTYAGMPIVGGV